MGGHQTPCSHIRRTMLGFQCPTGRLAAEAEAPRRAGARGKAAASTGASPTLLQTQERHRGSDKGHTTSGERGARRFGKTLARSDCSEGRAEGAHTISILNVIFDSERGETLVDLSAHVLLPTLHAPHTSFDICFRYATELPGAFLITLTQYYDYTNTSEHYKGFEEVVAGVDRAR